MKTFLHISTALLLSSHSFAAQDTETYSTDIGGKKTVRASLHIERDLSVPNDSNRVEMSFEGIDIMRDMKLLEGIILQNVFYSLDIGGKEISFEEFQALKPIAAFVYSLNLYETVLDNECMSIIPYFTNLRKLDISHNYFNDEGMKYLSSLQNLTSLRLTYNKVTAAGIKNLSSLHLEELDAGCTYLGNEGIKIISEIKSLKNVNIRACGFGDDALPYLTSMENLETVDISGNSKLTQEALLKFTEENKYRNLTIKTT